MKFCANLIRTELSSTAGCLYHLNVQIILKSWTLLAQRYYQGTKACMNEQERCFGSGCLIRSCDGRQNTVPGPRVKKKRIYIFAVLLVSSITCHVLSSPQALPKNAEIYAFCMPGTMFCQQFTFLNDWYAAAIHAIMQPYPHCSYALIQFAL